MTIDSISDYQKINDLAKSFFDKKDFNSALKILDIPDLPTDLIPNLAKCYYYTSQAHKAIALTESINNKTIENWIDLALYYNAIGDHQRAFEIYKTLDQSDDRVRFNIGWHYLRNNEFKRGFEHIQYGSKCRVWGHEYLYIEQGIINQAKRWNGAYTDHLVLILEGGLGDEMIFIRWANYLKTRCRKLTIVCNHKLLRLFVNAGYDCEPHSALKYLEYTAYTPAMSLPATLELNSPNEYINFPYIKSFSEPFITKQIDRIANGRKKIGVRFYGNPEFEHDQFRTPPREALESLSRYGQLFSLQIDEEDDRIPNCRHIIKDWQDTYSVFSTLDLLVTSCTSTAHLAGAMGIPTIVLVPLVPYFVWASDDMPWYSDNVTVIRQTKYNDWSDAINKLYGEVEKRLL